MRAVVSVFGQDKVGILASVATECAKANANVVEVSQNILNQMFQMVMIVEIDHLIIDLKEFVDQMSFLGQQMGLEIRVMHEDIFNSMHSI